MGIVDGKPQPDELLGAGPVGGEPDQLAFLQQPEKSCMRFENIHTFPADQVEQIAQIEDFAQSPAEAFQPFG